MKLTLFRADNTRVLPAYYSDNYISLLPGEERTLVVHVPSGAAGAGGLHFTLRGWNLPEKNLSEKNVPEKNVPLAIEQSSVGRHSE
jgi:hypothetical protein